jgi:hypothetical protein
MYNKVSFVVVLAWFVIHPNSPHSLTSPTKFQYAAKEFGSCPLVQCNGHPVLPMGLRDEIGIDTVKIFCPKCQCAYQPPPIRNRTSGHHPSSGGGAVDGAAFGTTFPHLFLLTFNNLVPDPLPADSAYIPRVFGFRVHQSGTRAQGNANAAALAAQALRSSNGRRGAVDTFTSQRVVSKSGGGEEGEAAVVQDAKDRTGTEVKVEIKARKKSVEEDGDGEAAQGGDRSKTSNDASSKSNSKKGVTANEDGVVKDEKADGGEGGSNNNSKRKGKEGDNSAVSNNENGGSSKSRSSKRQKRQSGGSEVT